MKAEQAYRSSVSGELFICAEDAVEDEVFHIFVQIIKNDDVSRKLAKAVIDQPLRHNLITTLKQLE